MTTPDTARPTDGIADLPGLGPASARMLATIGVRTRGDLARVGPLGALLRLGERHGRRPSLNLLYAMVGALEGRRWTDVAREERLPLLLALDAHDDHARFLRDRLVADTDDPEVTDR